MRPQIRSTRRDFIGTIGAGSVAALGTGLLPSGIGRQTDRGHEHPSLALSAKDYLFAPGLLYFGTATLGPCPRQVLEATQRAWFELEMNPSAMAYGDGASLTAAERVRHLAAEFMGCSPDEMIITRSTTDGMNIIALGLNLSPGDRVLTSDQEHPGGLLCWQYLAKRQGVVMDSVAIPPGENNPAAVVDRLSAAITPATRVISISHVLSSTGLLMPIADIATLARSRGILCVVDGAQAVGGIQVDVKKLGVHAYATSGHKWLMGPKGTGLLYLASETNETIQPIQLANGRTFHSEATGVANLPGVIGLGVAIELLAGMGMAEVERHNVALRDRIYDGLRKIPAATVVSPPPGSLASPLVTCSLPQRIDSKDIRATMREKHRMEVKMVPKNWMNGIRLSPHIFNTEAEVDALLAALRAELV